MSDYRMNLGRVGAPSDTNKIHEMLNILGKDDELIITIDSDGYEQADTIVNVLDANDFHVDTKGGHDGGAYNIRARRKG